VRLAELKRLVQVVRGPGLERAHRRGHGPGAAGDQGGDAATVERADLLHEGAPGEALVEHDHVEVHLGQGGGQLLGAAHDADLMAAHAQVLPEELNDRGLFIGEEDV
jgi:hypothetical protein